MGCLEKKFESYKKEFKTRADEEDNKYVARLVPTLGAFKLSEWILAQALKIPSIDVVDQTWDIFASETSVADQSRLALEYVYSYAVRNKDSFWKKGPAGTGSRPNDGWLGRCETSPGQIVPEGLGAGPSKEYLGYDPNKLKQLLRDEDFDAEAVIRQWHIDDLLLHDNGRKDYQVMLDCQRIRLIAIKKSAIDGLFVEGESESSDDAEPEGDGESQVDSP